MILALGIPRELNHRDETFPKESNLVFSSASSSLTVSFTRKCQSCKSQRRDFICPQLHEQEQYISCILQTDSTGCCWLALQSVYLPFTEYTGLPLPALISWVDCGSFFMSGRHQLPVTSVSKQSSPHTPSSLWHSYSLSDAGECVGNCSVPIQRPEARCFGPSSQV